MKSSPARKGLDAVLARAKQGQPFSRSQIASIEKQLGHKVPPDVRHVWQKVGTASFAGKQTHAALYDADTIADLLESYAESGLSGLLPLASDQGSIDYALDVVGRADAAPGTVHLSDRGVMDEGSLRPVASNLVDLLERVMADRIDYRARDLQSRWTKRHARPTADVEVLELHHGSSVPSRVKPRRNIELGGIPCRAGEEVVLDENGQVLLAMLSRDHEIGDVVCRARSLVAIGADGAVQRFTPKADITIDGIRWKAGHQITLPDVAQMTSGVLAKPAVIDAIPCAAEHVVLSGARLASATLAKKWTVCGVPLPAGAWFERFIYGDTISLYAVRLPKAAVIAGVKVPARKKHVLSRSASASRRT